MASQARSYNGLPDSIMGMKSKSSTVNWLQCFLGDHGVPFAHKAKKPELLHLLAELAEDQHLNKFDRGQFDLFRAEMYRLSRISKILAQDHSISFSIEITLEHSPLSVDMAHQSLLPTNLSHKHFDFDSSFPNRIIGHHETVRCVLRRKMLPPFQDEGR
jgi:hypothetical protein